MLVRSRLRPARRLPYLFLFLILAATGCASPRPVLRLEPLEPDPAFTAYRDGRLHVWQRFDGLEVEVAFLENDGTSLVFELWVSNMGTRVVDLHPGEIL